MPRSGCPYSVIRWLPWSTLLILVGCDSTTESTVRTASARRAEEVAAARLAQEGNAPKPASDVPVRPAGPTDTQPAPAFDVIDAQVADPAKELEDIQAELAGIPDRLKTIEAELAKPDLDPVRRQTLLQEQSDLSERQDSIPRLASRLESIRRPAVVKQSLKEAIRRTLLNSHAIQVSAYNPAIESARVVEAEAQFDAIFFTSWNYDKQNRPSSSQLSGTDTDNRVWQVGVKKLLSSGMQVQTGYNVSRTFTDLVFQTLNPSYFNQFFVEFRQPLLRGFGLDYNRSQIELRKLDRGINEEKLRQDVREILFNVEQAYWRLLQARRSVTVSARLVTDLETILYYLKQRFEIGLDVYRVQLKQTESRYEERVAEFIRLRNQVRTAEDTLKSLMNDPEINQIADLEIIPTDEPELQPLIVDVIGEVTAALEHRSELRQARLQIEQAKIAIGVAKNQALPQLDLVFRYVVDGLGGNWDQSFSQLSRNDFHEYLLQLQFEWPIGNRGPEAVLRQARLRQAQAIASHRAQIEQVILETQNAIRDLHTAYDQLGPSLRSALASAEQLRATKIRLEKLDPPNLQVYLNAHELLAAARQTLLQSLADYNVDLINLERRKGTLLKFNNVVINGSRDDAGLDAYRPVGP